MWYILKIGDYLKILTDDKMKCFVVINFGKYFKPTKEKLYSKLSAEKNLRKYAEPLYIFIITPNELKKHVKTSYSNKFICHYNVKILNLFNIYYH